MSKISWRTKSWTTKVSENRHLSEDKEIYVPENESEAYQLEKYGKLNLSK
jgi:hypothetical protein